MESVLGRLENEISLLPFEQQLWLVERVARRLQNHQMDTDDRERQLAAMAADPEIIAENRAIANEFAVTEGDGLQPVS